MAAFVPEILAMIGADASGAEAGLAEAGAATESSTGKMKGLFDKAEKAIGDSMKKALKNVVDAVGEMVSKFVDAGMGANAAAESIAAGFDKLEIIPVKIAPIVDAIDKVKDYVLKLKELSDSVPLSLGKIVELKGAMEKVGSSSEHLPDILQALGKSMGKAASDGGDAAKKFHELGISTDGWKEHMPGADTILVQLAEHIKNSKNPVEEMNKAEEVLGDHFRDLIPLLQQGGAKVKELAEAHVQNAREVEGSTAAFEHLHATESDLSNAMQNLLLPVFKLLAQVLDGLLQVITKLIEWFTNFAHAAVAAGKFVADYYTYLAKLTIDLFRPVFEWLEGMVGKAMNKLRELGQWFENVGHMALEAFTKVKNFFANLLEPVFKKIGEGIDWVVQKFNALKSWIGKVKDSVLEMAKPVIDTFAHLANMIGDFFKLHWGDVAKDAREAAAVLAGDVQKVISAAEGPAAVDDAHKFGGDGVAYVEKAEEKKTEAVTQGEVQRQGVVNTSYQITNNSTKNAANYTVQTWNSSMKSVEATTNNTSKEVSNTLQDMPKPLVPAVKKVASQTQQIMQTAAQNMAKAFAGAIRGMIDGTQTLGQAFAKIGQQMLSSMEDMLQKMLTDWLQNHIMQLLIHTETKQSEVAVEQASSTEKQAINMEEHLKNIFMAAKEAGANAWKAAPNPLLGAVEAAAAFAGVMAFGSMGSAEGGQYLVPGPQLTMLHAQEMVLPAGLANRMRDVIDGGGNGGSAGAFHLHMNVNTIDSNSFKDTLGKHGHMIGELVTKAMKKKGMK